MIIRGERPQDRPAILQLNRDAFGGDGEAELIERLDADGLVAVSLAAEEGGRIVGHILLSWLRLEMDERRLRGLALAPMAVAPADQRRGVGSLLVKAAIEAGRRAGADAIIVIAPSPGRRTLVVRRKGSRAGEGWGERLCAIDDL